MNCKMIIYIIIIIIIINEYYLGNFFFSGWFVVYTRAQCKITQKLLYMYVVRMQQYKFISTFHTKYYSKCHSENEIFFFKLYSIYVDKDVFLLLIFSHLIFGDFFCFFFGFLKIKNISVKFRFEYIYCFHFIRKVRKRFHIKCVQSQ